MKRMMAVLLGAALFLTASAAMATQITGYIDFGGQQQLTKSTPGGVTFATAETISFSNPASIMVAEGDFTVIPTSAPVYLTNFTFAPALSPNPVVPLWQVSFGTPIKTFTFDLTSINVIRDAKSLELYGGGILHATGFDDTPGVWDLTTQAATGSIKGKLSFSEDTAAAPVPEPASMVLLGAGFLGLAVYGKRRKNG